MLVDVIAQGNACSSSPGDRFAFGAQEGSPVSVQQLNGSATNRAESFDLDTNNIMGDVSGSSSLTQRLLADFVLKLTKHVMHWAASEHITVDPVRWSHLANDADADGFAASPSNLGNCIATGERGGWLAAKVKMLCNRASSVVLDGIDRTPSSWCCLIKYAKLVFKYSTAALEAALERETQEIQDRDERRGEQETGTGMVDRLEETLVGLLLPAVATGLLSFAHIPVFARSLLDIVNVTLGLLDETCSRCQVTRLADEKYVAARNGGREGQRHRRKPQVRQDRFGSRLLCTHYCGIKWVFTHC